MRRPTNGRADKPARREEPASGRVNTRRIFSGDGSESWHLIATCPLCERSLPLEEHAAPEVARASALQQKEPPAEPSDHHRGLLRLLEAELSSPAARTPISQFMTRDVLCVRADLSVESLASLLVERNLTGAPVVAGDGRLIGTVSIAELVRDQVENGDTQEEVRLRVPTRGGGGYYLGGGFHAEVIARKTVGEIMLPISATLNETDAIARAAAVMAYESVAAIPIVDDERRVVGIITALHVTRWLAQQAGYLLPQFQTPRSFC
jgi:CBS domain-containing protein